MTVKDAIDLIDSNKPNLYTEEMKVRWLDILDSQIHNDIIKTHKDWDGEEYERIGALSDTLIVPFPYDDLYIDYLKMKIDEENGDVTRYNNSRVMFNSSYDNFERFYNKNHLPVGVEHLSLY